MCTSDGQKGGCASRISLDLPICKVLDSLAMNNMMDKSDQAGNLQKERGHQCSRECSKVHVLIQLINNMLMISVVSWPGDKARPVYV